MGVRQQFKSSGEETSVVVMREACRLGVSCSHIMTTTKKKETSQKECQSGRWTEGTRGLDPSPICPACFSFILPLYGGLLLVAVLNLLSSPNPSSTEVSRIKPPGQLGIKAFSRQTDIHRERERERERETFQKWENTSRELRSKQETNVFLSS